MTKSMEAHVSDMKDELRSQEELSVAAAGYIPVFWLILLLFARWRKNYFTRYHLVHAALLTISRVLLIVVTVLFSYFSASSTGFNFGLVLVTGTIIGLSLLLGAGTIFYCALNAYRGRYTVMPILTRIYYLIFSPRTVHSDNPYDSRRISQLRPYLKQTPQDPRDRN